MEMKSVSDCLNIIDFVITENMVRNFDIPTLEIIRKYLIEKEQSDFIENMTVLSNVLCQINSIKENHYQLTEGDIKSEYVQLGKLILVWLIEGSTEPEVDDY